MSHASSGSQTKGDVLLRKEESKGSALPSGAEGAPEGHSFEDLPAGLTGVGLTRSQALKLAGLGGAGFLFTLMWPDAADARRRRRRRRKAQVTPVVVVPGAATVLNITNPDDTDDLIISGLEVLGRRGKVIDTIDLEPDVEIAPGETEIVPVLIEDSLVNARKLRLIDDTGAPITVVDENGVTVGDIDVA
jgi:hypothetical protein